MIKVMIWAGLLLCVMGYVTDCSCKGNDVRCPNITGTIGENLTLKCTVSENGCVMYKWMKDKNKPKNYSCSSVTKSFMYTIENASMKDNGTWAFWMQLNSGHCCTCFNVNISGHPTGDSAPQEHPTKAPQEPKKQTSDSPKMAGIIMASGITLGLVIVFAVYWRRRRRNTQPVYMWDSLGPIRACPDPTNTPCSVCNPDEAHV